VIKHAVEALLAGQIVVIPTDTVYGIAALPEIPTAVRAVFRAKARTEDKPLPILAAGADDLAEVAVLNARARKVAERFWPGPLTLVLPRAPGFTHDLGGDAHATVAVRVPDSAIALEILQATGPLAVTSANLSGHPPATTLSAAHGALGHAVDVFIDGGICDGGASSVVALVDTLSLMRAGPIELDAIVRVLRS
jgi:tRNA threonylcarbamoyl adenosine modification protein (Sua5/YciO/YrdC/YwlC family)